jgi:transposase-like protein
MNCVYCESKRIVKNGKDQAAGQMIQTYRCNDCGQRFNERSGTPMARLRSAPEVIALAMKVRSEGLGIRATGKVLEKSGTSIINWEKRLSEQVSNWSPPAPERSEVTLKGDEVYTRVGENLPPRSLPRVDDSLYRTNQSLLG